MTVYMLLTDFAAVYINDTNTAVILHYFFPWGTSFFRSLSLSPNL